MPIVQFSESEMKFGPFDSANIFLPERSNTYIKIKGAAVKTCEFVLLDDSSVPTKFYFIEAKASCPRAANIEDFQKYIDDITTKFSDSLLFFLSLRENRHADSKELSTKLAKIKISDIEFIFLLVIKGAEKDWLIPINDKLTFKIKPILKIWNNAKTKIYSLNEEDARKKRIVI